MVTLNANMTDSQSYVPLTAGDAKTLPLGFYQIDDEYVEVVAPHPVYNAAKAWVFDGVSCLRGVGGSSVAAHLEDAEMVRYYPEAPSGESFPITADSGGADEAGQSASLEGGTGNDGEFGGGSITADGGAADNHGAAWIRGGGGNDFAGGVGATGKNDATGDGGDVYLIPGELTGIGRNGLIFPMRLPSADPEIEGALYTDGAPGPGDPKALKVSGGAAP